ALRDRDLDLDPRPVEVQFQRNERLAGLLDLLRDLEDLLLVQQQLATPPRRVIRPRALRVLRDEDMLQPRLALEDEGEPVREVGAALAQRLHLSAGEDEARFIRVLDVVLVQRLPIARDGLA